MSKSWRFDSDYEDDFTPAKGRYSAEYMQEGLAMTRKQLKKAARQARDKRDVMFEQWEARDDER